MMDAVGERDATTRGLVPGPDDSLEVPPTSPRTVSSTAVEPVSVEPEPGDVLGRYTLLERLGSGGMGVVFGAHDRQLDRRVAIKVLRSRPAGASDWSEGRARLLREAQAMAQLSHPHVVEVFDVGAHDDGVLYLAMELVDGMSLGRWLRAQARGWREVIAMFVQAGEGLAAAHEAGMVHRDFKPGNVIVDADDHARVLDFGLALPALDRRSADGIRRPSESLIIADKMIATDRLMSPVTEVGMVMGTPAYMAPEQHRGDEIGPTADQYAFCAALYEGVYGTRPFGSSDSLTLMKAKCSGVLPSPAADHPAPPELLPILARGLSVAVEDRWPSMPALLEELRRIVAPRRRRWPVAVAGLLGLGGVTVTGAMLLLGPSPPSACEGAAERMEQTWGDDARQAVRTALSTEQAAYSADTVARVERSLDDYAAHWLEVHGEVCTEEPQDSEALARRERRLDCLARRRRRMGAVIELLGDAESELLMQATSLAQGLPALERCMSEAPGDRSLMLPDDPEAAVRVREVLEALEEVQALVDAGRYERAHARMLELSARAEALDYEPLQVRTGTWLGDTLLYLGEHDAARTQLEQTLYRAEAMGDDGLVVFIATRLVFLVGDQQGWPDEGLAWARHAEARLSRLGADSRAEAEMRTTVGAVLSGAGRSTEAVGELSRAVQLWTQLEGPDDLQTAAARNNLGIAYYELGRFADAVAEYEQVRRIREATLGPEHPDIGVVLNNLANALSELGEYERALTLRRRVLAIWRAGLGERHPYVAAALNNLGNSAVTLGQRPEAVDSFERALEIREEVFGPEHPEVAITRLNLGVTLGEDGRFEEALSHLREAQAILDRTVGEHPWTAASGAALGTVLALSGELEAAARVHREALAMKRRVHGDEHPEVATSHRELGEVLEEQGRLPEAQDHLERALAIEVRGSVAPQALAGTRFALARVLRAQGSEPERARRLGEQALEGWENVPPHQAEDREALRVWLGESME